MRYSSFAFSEWVAMAAGALTALVAALWGGPAPAAGKFCTDLSRDCVIAVAKTHIDMHRDLSLLPVARYATELRHIENGIVFAGLPDGKNFPPADQWRVHEPDRVWVDGSEAMFSYVIDLKDPANGQFVRTAHIWERFKVEMGRQCANGLPQPCITEIEAIFCVAPRPNEQAWPGEAWQSAATKGAAQCERKGQGQNP